MLVVIIDIILILIMLLICCFAEIGHDERAFFVSISILISVFGIGICGMADILSSNLFLKLLVNQIVLLAFMLTILHFQPDLYDYVNLYRLSKTHGSKIKYKKYTQLRNIAPENWHESYYVTYSGNGVRSDFHFSFIGFITYNIDRHLDARTAEKERKRLNERRITEAWLKDCEKKREELADKFSETSGSDLYRKTIEIYGCENDIK